MSTKSMLDRYVSNRPLAVMTRTILSEVISDELDEVFHENRLQGYERELLFSELASAIAEVCLGFCRSPNKAYEKLKDELKVSKTAFYEKLRRVEPAVCRASVKHSYQCCSRMMQALGHEPWEWIPGYHCKIIDGNHLEGCENRLKELRGTWASGLPGSAIVVLDGQLQMAEDIFLIPDGHAQERSVFDEVIASVNPNDLIVADSHYCTIKFMTGIDERKACFVVRQHGSLKGQLLDERRFIADSESGSIFEQSLQVGGEDGVLLRRITVELKEPTRDGDQEIHILSNLPERHASAEQIAEVYRSRHDVEYFFYLATTTLTCEVPGLNYPQAALFVFSVAMMALNCRQVLMACLVSAHGEEIAEEVSQYSIAFDISRTYDGLLVALDDEEWRDALPKTLKARMKFLTTAANNLDRTRYKKAIRGPKKPPPPKGPYENGKHLSVQKVLNARK